MGAVSPYRTILFARDGAIARVTLNRPERLNAYDMEMRDDLYTALSAVRDDPSLRVVLLAGRGRAFCSGGDVREFGSAPSPVVAREVRWRRDVWGLLHSLPQLTIAAVHGHAAGSGMEMALLCDFRIAAANAVFSLPETALGMIPGVVGTQTAPRMIGLGRALSMVLAGATIDAREARRIGMVGAVVPAERFAREADRLARSLAEIDGRLAAATKELVIRGLDLPLEAALARERRVAARVGRVGSGGREREGSR
ncbi:MAG: 3-hydroxypropionyl-coenzyme dehydratase [Candidatus Binatota bacterium]|nr:3-hydroxypropionyl-coenzyme dehydratase [Candidatus Binatota bacterium]